jgi:hypothetical protein
MHSSLVLKPSECDVICTEDKGDEAKVVGVHIRFGKLSGSNRLDKIGEAQVRDRSHAI